MAGEVVIICALTPSHDSITMAANKNRFFFMSIEKYDIIMRLCKDNQKIIICKIPLKKHRLSGGVDFQKDKEQYRESP